MIRHLLRSTTTTKHGEKKYKSSNPSVNRGKVQNERPIGPSSSNHQAESVSLANCYTLSRTSGGGEKLLPLIVPSLCVAERRGGGWVECAGVFMGL